MKLCNLALGLALAGSGIGCGGNTAAPSATGERAALADGSANPRESSGNNASGRQQGGGKTIPKDAQWTILCATFGGADHLVQAKAAREKLIQSTGMNDWYLVTADGRSTLYYGYYRSINDPKDQKESQRAQQDRKSIDVMKDATGRKLFATAFLVELDSADPASMPEWNLENARGAYTVQVGVYKGGPERKQAALDAVRQARAMGLPAYYYHGPTASSVCVGAWPQEAVREQADVNVKTFDNPDAVPVVVPGGTKLPENARTPDGRPISVVHATYEVLDPTLMDVLKRFPKHSLNGAEEWEVVDPRTQQKRRVSYPSRVVKIPASATGGPALADRQPTAQPRVGPGVNASAIQPVDPAVGPTVVNQPPPPVRKPTPQPPAPRGGKLKSLDE